ncbi:MAG: hypothetical protein IID51_11850 [Proteobacteria bacterium]|nr:hypothetical protein [Pseudomonadota bacterium]
MKNSYPDFFVTRTLTLTLSLKGEGFSFVTPAPEPGSIALFVSFRHSPTLFA